ncbi:hypothetical protein LJC71_08925 [Desulfosarcina sp. OttesenSCG-928-A07]|nr:hypothetical protein [Desulfosarcina sp. OttesenSCG-928-G17]MDL2329848.1 hypothetical protein [Desulfosarcina sp. OttesenSCG-928-A07]
MKKLHVPCLSQLETLPMAKAENGLRTSGEKNALDCVNWKAFPQKPEVHFVAAHTGKSILLAFTVREDVVLARFEADQSPVYRDSCVEFFCRKPGTALYTNLEFNCIGACLGARQRARDTERTFLSEKELSGIERYASLGKRAFGEKKGKCAWNLMVRIPLSILGMEEKDLAVGLGANFYKCCDDAPEKHYLSWNPIQTESPDFHRPEFFGHLVFAY